jgi:hypothetical protein
MSPAYINLGWLARSQLVSLTEQLSAIGCQLSVVGGSLLVQGGIECRKKRIRKNFSANSAYSAVKGLDFLGVSAVKNTYATAAAAAYFGA